MTTTNDQTTTRLTEIRARLDAATPAPWTRFARNASAPDEDDWYLGHDVHGPPRAQRGQIERVADAELIAHAPDDLAHLLALVDQLQGQLDEARAENARPAAQERASGPETPQGHPSEGTGVPGPEKPVQTADGYTTAELISRTLVFPFGTRHNRGHIREIAAHIDNEIRPVHWREAAAFLRALGHDTAAEHKARRGGGPGSLTEAGARFLTQAIPDREDHR